MKKILTVCSSVFMGLMGSGCSTYTNKLDCPYGKGLGCASVSRVNRIIDNKEIDLDEDPSSTSKRVHVYYGQSKLSKIIDIPSPRP